MHTQRMNISIAFAKVQPFAFLLALALGLVMADLSRANEGEGNDALTIAAELAVLEEDALLMQQDVFVDAPFNHAEADWRLAQADQPDERWGHGRADGQPEPDDARDLEREPEQGMRGDGEDRPGQGPPPMRERMTRENFENVLAVLKDIDPDLYEKFQELKKDKPMRAFGLLREHGPLLRRLVFLKERDEESYDLRVSDIRLSRETMQLAEQIVEEKNQRELDVEKLTKLYEQLEKKVDMQFTVRQDLRQHELEMLRKRLEAMEQGIKLREDKRDDIIEAQVEELIDRAKKPRPGPAEGHGNRQDDAWKDQRDRNDEQ